LAGEAYADPISLGSGDAANLAVQA
jgi:hypothetical protein